MELPKEELLVQGYSPLHQKYKEIQVHEIIPSLGTLSSAASSDLLLPPFVSSFLMMSLSQCLSFIYSN